MDAYAKRFENPVEFNAIAIPVYTYNQGLSTKYTVNLVLFYMTIRNLGTEIHEKYKESIKNGEDLGCFALTELSHGSNVRGIQTTATYDKATDEFIINTPNDLAMKFWIGGASKTATLSAVFANLIIDGKNEGPHVFVVPLRDKHTYNVLPGIIIGDCGKKIGQESIDNGFIIFNNFRIPRTNLLNRMSNVTREGKFETTIPNPDQRLALILGGISQGRLLIIGFAPRIIGYGLKIALRFAAMRRQFSKPGETEEIPLIEYPLHQYRLFPYLANVIAFLLASNKVYVDWNEISKDLFNSSAQQSIGELHATISALKAVHSWAAMRGLQECREACGGLGYSHYSKLGILRANWDVQQTWEGDNNVLLQQTAKYLIDIIKAKFKGKEVKTRFQEWIKTEPVEGTRNEAQTEEDFLKDSNLLEIFKHRSNLLLQRSALKLSGKLSEKGVHPLDAWNDTQVFYLHHLSKSYGELFDVLQFYNYIQRLRSGELKTNEDTKECMILLYQLHCLSRIDADLGTFRDGDYLSSEHGELIKQLILKLCGQVKRHAIPLVESFYPGEELFDSMIAPANGDLYGSILNRIYYSGDAFGRVSNWKDCLQTPE